FNILWYIFILILSAIPMNIAVKFMGGRSSILKVLFANLVYAVLFFLIEMYVDIWTIFSFILMIFVYKVIFEMGWIRTILAWLLQFIILAIFVVILGLFGITLTTVGFFIL
ncbi:MAG: hypothetical protein ACLFPJ_04450, partial [Candidatus Woesearchaeota archaeon]